MKTPAPAPVPTKTNAQRVADHKERLLAAGGRRITVSLPADAAAALDEIRASMALPNATAAVIEALLYASERIKRRKMLRETRSGGVRATRM